MCSMETFWLSIHTLSALNRSTAQYRGEKDTSACLPVLDNAEEVCQRRRQLSRLQHLDGHGQPQGLRSVLCCVEVDAPAVGADLKPDLHRHGGR